MEQALIEEIARIAGATLVDLQEGLYDRPDLLPDALHPNAEGAGILARTVYGALTGDYGGLQLPAIYSDRMVLQRDQPLPISGIANQGEKVTVTLAGQRKETVAGTNGKWTVTLDLAGKREILYLNGFYPQPHAELSGCSSRGSLAMLRTIQHGVPGKRERKGRTTATIGYVKQHSQIRLFDLKPRWETYAVEWDASVLDSLNRLQYYHDAQWEVCDTQNTARFSAIGFAFGRMLADSLQVPVGLILNAVGGSPTEAWIDRKTLEFEFPDILQDWTKNDFIQDWVRERAALNIKQASNRSNAIRMSLVICSRRVSNPFTDIPSKGLFGTKENRTPIIWKYTNDYSRYW